MTEQSKRALVFVLDCTEPVRLAAFWSAALDYHVAEHEEPYIVLLPNGDGPELILQRVTELKVAKNRMHVDIRVDDLEREVDRLVQLGASLVAEQPVFEGGLRWFVMRDLEGNEFCVVAPDRGE